MKIVIVGGVAAGMSAAARARRLDESAQIIVLERGAYPSFANCGLPYYVGGEIHDDAALLVQTPESLHVALNLDVRVHHDVTHVDPSHQTVTAMTPQGEQVIGYDALIVAPGAQAIHPAIPGLTAAMDARVATTLRTVDDAVNLRSQIEAHRGTHADPQRAVVLGAGFIGVEAAEALQLQGLSVDLVELAPHVVPPLERELAAWVTDELRRLSITVHEGVSADAIERIDDGWAVQLSDGTQISTDIVVLSVGVRPDTAVFEAAGIACERGAIIVTEHGQTNLPNIWAAGDATVSIDAATGVRRPVPLAGPANRAGRLIADHILAPETARPIPTALGTAILRVGDLTVAMTGANRSALDAAGVDYETIHLHPNHHAGYFPGATAIHLMVHVRCGDGLILGAQAVGAAGVDKRIDVIATTLRHRGTAQDLIDLDLAYAPPYGSAKDPINLAGMMAQNVLNGTVNLWHAADLAEVKRTAFILDVRSAAEYRSGFIPGAMNIPHTQVRERLDEIVQAAAGRPVRVHCQSGMRSYLASRVLADHGLDVAHLSGGMATLRAWLGDAALSELAVG